MKHLNAAMERRTIRVFDPACDGSGINCEHAHAYFACVHSKMSFSRHGYVAIVVVPDRSLTCKCKQKKFEPASDYNSI